MKQLFDTISAKCSKLTTRHYSTSFSLGIKFLDKNIHQPIYAIYGFVRFADEIVDSFHDYNKKQLLEEFWQDTYKALERGISLNPILNSFQHTVKKYNINTELIDTFLQSMEMDLEERTYNQAQYEKYILGSAEVVGLMCLKVFVNGEEKIYNELKPLAMKLGSAFQKINFLRDLNTDYNTLGRIYFPNVKGDFNPTTKAQIEQDIEVDFKQGLEGIKKLPKNCQFGVYLAYVYYYRLFKKIKKTSCKTILNKRVRIPNNTKYMLFFGSYAKHRLNWL